MSFLMQRPTNVKLINYLDDPTSQNCRQDNGSEHMPDSVHAGQRIKINHAAHNFSYEKGCRNYQQDLNDGSQLCKSHGLSCCFRRTLAIAKIRKESYDQRKRQHGCQHDPFPAASRHQLFIQPYGRKQGNLFIEISSKIPEEKRFIAIIYCPDHKLIKAKHQKS